MDEQALLQAAAEARKFARARSFRVGAALVAKDGTVVTGCNVEIFNTCSSICAERTALVKAVSMGYQEFEAIAVVSDAPVPISPCGFCRQYLADFGLDIQVLMGNANLSKVVRLTSGELLPMPFLGSETDSLQE